MAGTGFCSASSGSQMRAASIVPSFKGINACSMTRTVLGKLVTIISNTPIGPITQPFRGDQPVRPLRFEVRACATIVNPVRTSLLIAAPRYAQPFLGNRQCCAFPGGMVESHQLLLSVNDSSCNHGTVQCNPTQARQIDVPVMLPDSEP